MKAKSVKMPAVGQNPQGVRELNASVGAVHTKDYPPAKTSGIRVRGGKAQTKGFMARGPMA